MKVSKAIEDMSAYDQIIAKLRNGPRGLLFRRLARKPLLPCDPPYAKTLRDAGLMVGWKVTEMGEIVAKRIRPTVKEEA